VGWTPLVHEPPGAVSIVNLGPGEADVAVRHNRSIHRTAAHLPVGSTLTFADNIGWRLVNS